MEIIKASRTNQCETLKTHSLEVTCILRGNIARVSIDSYTLLNRTYQLDFRDLH